MRNAWFNILNTTIVVYKIALSRIKRERAFYQYIKH